MCIKIVDKNAAILFLKHLKPHGFMSSIYENSTLCTGILLFYLIFRGHKEEQERGDM